MTSPARTLARVMRFPGDSVSERPVSGFSEDALGILTHLRIAALACRCSARTEMVEACRVLSADPLVSRARFADALVRSLPQILRRPVQFFSPGVSEISADEAWLLRLILSLRSGDAASAEFLLQSRVPRHLRRTLRFLANGAGSL